MAHDHLEARVQSHKDTFFAFFLLGDPFDPPFCGVAGYREALHVARNHLEARAQNHGADPVAFRADLLNIARTTLSSKILTHDKEHFAQLAVDAVLRLRGSANLEAIHIIKKTGGTLKARHEYSLSHPK